MGNVIAEKASLIGKTFDLTAVEQRALRVAAAEGDKRPVVWHWWNLHLMGLSPYKLRYDDDVLQPAL